MVDTDALLKALGRKQLQLEQQDQAYSNIMLLLVDVVTGTISHDRVMINLTDRTWHVAAPGEFPAMPATINGQPVCVVGIT